MEVYDCIRYRLTVRRFKSAPVPEEVITKILQAAQWAPSSRNLQPWHFIVTTDREALRRISDISTTGNFIADAPVAIAVVMDSADAPGLDAGRAIQQMELLAWSEGLGTCFAGLSFRASSAAGKRGPWNPGEDGADNGDALWLQTGRCHGQVQE